MKAVAAVAVEDIEEDPVELAVEEPPPPPPSGGGGGGIPCFTSDDYTRKVEIDGATPNCGDLMRDQYLK